MDLALANVAKLSQCLDLSGHVGSLAPSCKPSAATPRPSSHAQALARMMAVINAAAALNAAATAARAVQNEVRSTAAAER